ncbi:MAG: ABC transporter substrate-binding protein [Pseudonocardia sp.]
MRTHPGRPSTRRPVLLALTVAVTLVSAACSAGGQGESAQDQTLRTASTRDFKAAPQGRSLVFDTLLDLDENGDPVPLLAESWENSADQRTYTFTLKDGVSFHDGTPFSAETAKFSIEYAATTVPFGRFISSVDAVDPSTVRISLTAPYSLLLDNLASELSVKMISPTSVVPAGDLAGKLDNYIGTGPYRLENYRKDQDAELVRNQEYWGGAPALERIVWLTIPDPYTQVLALRAGEVDLIGAAEHHSALPYSEMAKLNRAGEYTVEYRSYGRYQVIDFNTIRAPLDDARVRQAFNAAVDREAMVATLFEGLAEPVRYLNPTSDVWKLGPQVGLAGFAYDPDRANALLDEAGWLRADPTGVRTKDGNPLRVSLLVPFGEANADVTSLYVQSELRKVGAQVEVTTLDSSAAAERRKSGDYDMYVHHSCSTATTGCLGPDGKYTTGYGFPGVYATPELDRLIEQALTAEDEPAQRAAFDQVWETLHREAVGLPLYDIAKPVAYRQGVSGFGFGSTMFTMDLRDVKV